MIRTAPPTQILSAKQITDFQKGIYSFYQQNKRHFPWRETTDPYKILVSELMLQQTQTFRVLPKYQTFISQFPTIDALAKATLTEVLTLWSGLGYNRRAKFLHQAARYLLQNYHGQFPKVPKTLQQIPGIGAYTASAIITFAFNQPTVFIETNIRRTFIHSFFPDQDTIDDQQLIPLIAQTLDNKHPREWYYALMDYGSDLKTKIKNPNQKSKHYAKQSKFAGSVRQVRGEIIRQLLNHSPQSITTLTKKVNDPRFEIALAGLKKDQLVEQQNNQICLK